MEKIMIREEKEINSLTGPVDYIIEVLQQYKNSDWYVENIEDEYYYEQRRDYISTKTILTRTRLETDEEYNKRLEEYNKRLELLETQQRIKKEEAKEKRLRKKEKERQEYERLKKKFEKS